MQNEAFSSKEEALSLFKVNSIKSTLIIYAWLKKSIYWVGKFWKYFEKREVKKEGKKKNLQFMNSLL